MTTPLLVAAGDLHLDDTIWKHRRAITGDAIFGLRAVYSLATELRVPVLLLGDLFDSTEPSSGLVEQYRLESKKLHEAGLAEYAIQGNHDKRAVPWYCAASPYPIHIGNGREVQIGPARIVGFDYAPQVVIEEQLAELATRPTMPNILLLHQAVRQSLKFDGAWNCDLDWVPDGIPLCLMGDIHRAQQLDMRNGGVAFYSGSTHPRSIEEIGSKGCLILNQDLTVEHRELPCRAIEKVVFTRVADGTAQLSRISGWVEQSLRLPVSSVLKPVLWLSYTEDQTAAVQEVQRICGDQVILVEQPLVFRTEDKIATTNDGQDLPTMAQLLSRVIDPTTDQFAYQLALDLIGPSGSVPERLRAQRDRFIASL